MIGLQQDPNLREEDDEEDALEGVVSIPMFEEGKFNGYYDIPLNGGSSINDKQSIDFITQNRTIHMRKPGKREICPYCKKDTSNPQKIILQNTNEEEGTENMKNLENESNEPTYQLFKFGLLSMLNVFETGYSIEKMDHLDALTFMTDVYHIHCEPERKEVYLLFNANIEGNKMIADLSINIYRYVTQMNWTVVLSEPFSFEEEEEEEEDISDGEGEE